MLMDGWMWMDVDDVDDVVSGEGGKLGGMEEEGGRVGGEEVGGKEWVEWVELERTLSFHKLGRHCRHSKNEWNAK